MTIKVTEIEITWRQKVIEDYVFMVQVIEDGSCTFSRKYASAVEAVNVFNSFRDHGMCQYWREIVMIEPNGKAHSKSFNHPLSKSYV